MTTPRIRKAPIRFDLSGVPEIDRWLKELGRNYGDSVERRLSRSALGAGLSTTAKLIKADAPADTMIKKAVGTQLGKNKRKNIHEAKVGLNVGNRKNTAPHAHFYVLGTKTRQTKLSRNRGRVSPRRFVRGSVQAGRGQILGAMTRRIQERLPIEIARAKARAKG